MSARLPPAARWLIRDAGAMFGAERLDVRVQDGVVAAIAAGLTPEPGERVIEARGAALLPGLHDHHLHLQALAAARESLRCGPPAVTGIADLQRQLRDANAASSGWLRGVGYHDSVAGEIDRHWLDRCIPDRPVRIQHRSGRLWILNGRALERLGPPGTDAPRAVRRGFGSGRFLDSDAWLRARLGAPRPALDAASRELARRGVTGVTDATPANDLAQYAHFAATLARGELLQRLCVMGDESLDGAAATADLAPGATKLHLHEYELPDFDALCGRITRSHAAGRPVAAHCVTIAELAYFSAALQASGPRRGDRVEHGAMIPADWLSPLRDAGVTIVTQPNFVFERGDRYLVEVEANGHHALYRARSLLEAGIGIAAGTDAPFGEPDPWRAMQAAVERRTRDGAVLGGDEVLSPERACGLFLGAAADPATPLALPRPGMPADLCLLDRTWRQARAALGDVRVRLTLRDGRTLWDAAAGDESTNPDPRSIRDEDHRQAGAVQRPRALRQRRA